MTLTNHNKKNSGNVALPDDTGPSWLAASLVAVVFLAFQALPASTRAAETLNINLITNDLVYDPVSRRIYASIPSTMGPERGNTITVINPESGVLESSVFVGSEPGPLAVSDDGKYVYVGLNGAGAVRRFDIRSRTAGLQFSLGLDSISGPRFARDIEVLPWNSNAIAVSRRFDGVSPGRAGIAIYDDDVMRPITTTRHTGSDLIEFSEVADLLYGYDSQGRSGFHRLSVTEAGVEKIDVAPSLLNDFGLDIEFADGLIYSTDGNVIDPETIALVGTYAASGPVEVDAQQGLVYFLEDEACCTRIVSIFNLETFELLGTVPAGLASGTASTLLRWGSDGLAFGANGTSVTLISKLGFSIPKSISGGPDVDDDQNVDVAVEARQSTATTYEFEIAYNNPGGPDVAIVDTVPRPWRVVEIAGQPVDLEGNARTHVRVADGSGGKVDAFLLNSGRNGTLLLWRPAPVNDNSVINVTAATRGLSLAGVSRFAPFSCGQFLLNRGAEAFELDPVTGRPLRDPQTGELLPPILDGNALVLAAVKDLNGGGLVGDGRGDEDGDGLSDGQEVFAIGTNPCNADSDGDGVIDGDDSCPKDAGPGNGVNLNGCPSP